MRWLALGSAVGGGAICAVVATVAVERLGGLDALLAPVREPAAPAATPLVAGPPAARETPETTRPEPSPAAEPAFDVVRVEPGGDAVIAGHAAPRAAVELRDGPKTLARVEADSSGQFVILPDPLTAGEHELRLAAVAPEGPERLSPAAPVVVEAAKPRLAAASRSGDPAIAPSPEPKLPPVETAVAAIPPPAAIPRELPAAPALAAPEPSVKAPPVAVPAAPTPPLPAVPAAPAPASVALNIAEAKPDDSGGLHAQGTAAPGAKIRLMLNGSYLAEVVANAVGAWSLTIERGLTAGLYALRAETLEAGGRTSASAEAAFAYAPKSAPAPTMLSAGPAALAAQPFETLQPAPPVLVANGSATAPAPDTQAKSVVAASADPSHAVVAEIRTATVVRGDNLWDLARHFYGDGLRYSDIFRANAALIHNPNLIYIGQVFVVPQPAPAAR